METEHTAALRQRKPTSEYRQPWLPGVETHEQKSPWEPEPRW